jgi:hypothetical protein
MDCIARATNTHTTAEPHTPLRSVRGSDNLDTVAGLVDENPDPDRTGPG